LEGSITKQYKNKSPHLKTSCRTGNATGYFTKQHAKQKKKNVLRMNEVLNEDTDDDGMKTKTKERGKTAMR